MAKATAKAGAGPRAQATRGPGAATKGRAAAKALRGRPAAPAAATSAAAATGGAAPNGGTPWFLQYAGSNNAEYEAYMRNEWGWEKRGEAPLFEKLSLEGQQAGLSWATVLAKRGAYRKAFHQFNVAKCAAMTDRDVDGILKAAANGPGGREAVICHRAKLLCIPSNARCVRALRNKPYKDPKTGESHTTLDGLLWSFVGGTPKLNSWASSKEIPSVTPVAEEMSKTLKKLGFAFVGATMCYSLMQSCGLVVDHPRGTPEHKAAAARLAALPQSRT